MILVSFVSVTLLAWAAEGLDWTLAGACQKSVSGGAGNS